MWCVKQTYLCGFPGRPEEDNYENYTLSKPAIPECNTAAKYYVERGPGPLKPLQTRMYACYDHLSEALDTDVRDHLNKSGKAYEGLYVFTVTRL